MDPGAPQPQGDVQSLSLGWDAPFPSTLSSFGSMEHLHLCNRDNLTLTQAILWDGKKAPKQQRSVKAPHSQVC